MTTVPATAAPASAAEGALRVEVAEGIEDAPDMPGWIADRNPELARQVADAPGGERWIAVEIGGEYLDFRYRVVPMRDGQAVGEAGEWIACPCSNDELLVRIDAGIAAAVEKLRAPVDNGSETSETHEPNPPPQRPEPTYRTMTGIGTTGIVVGAVGVGGVIVGGVLMGVGDRVPGDYQHIERDYRPPGLALLVGGGVALGAGVAMLVTDLVQCRRHHPRCLVEAESSTRAAQSRWGSRSVAIAPWLGARGVGLSGRF
ncbi:hypothetical protein [Paraliomyxa miuraensis]|uniref:hypothetical protein n=1 Tax=Paraliomyxa miuraensis TaxID=376150 RepID=UPI00225205C7|nr:hypothetical protein [Paraliomyxa miuraensis]MCX4247132.1 hypothetical protein [Paraliomyxa miuraensis]